VPENSQTPHPLLNFICFIRVPFFTPTEWGNSIALLVAVEKYALNSIYDLRLELAGFINKDNSSVVFMATYDSRLVEEAITVAQMSS
jgi:hypothetical protein